MHSAKLPLGIERRKLHLHLMSIPVLFPPVPTRIKLQARQPCDEETLPCPHSATPSASSVKKTPGTAAKTHSRRSLAWQKRRELVATRGHPEEDGGGSAKEGDVLIGQDGLDPEVLFKVGPHVMLVANLTS